MKKNPAVYVVTRDGRRIEENNYSNHGDAKDRAARLREMLAEWDPSAINSVSITKTDKPKRIR
tara:strand:- start:204 stop:392 length:189 start_codon:yes stop_codon:yes gene_type:complete